MRKNMGNIDAIIRVLVGTLLIIGGFMLNSWWGLVGLVLVFTGTISWCPIYRILKIDTCSPDLETEV